MSVRKAREAVIVQSFISHVEEANYGFSPDAAAEAAFHLSAAKIALRDIQTGKLEHKISKAAWEYITATCAELRSKALAVGHEQIVNDCHQLFDEATRMIPLASLD